MKKLFFALLLLLNFSGAWALAPGKCAYDTKFDPPYPTTFTFSGLPLDDRNTPFFVTTMTLKYTCLGPIDFNFNPILHLLGAKDIIRGVTYFSGLSGKFGSAANPNITVSDTCNGKLMQPGAEQTWNTSNFTYIFIRGNGQNLTTGESCTGTLTTDLSYFTNGAALGTGLSITDFFTGDDLTPGGWIFARYNFWDEKSSKVTGINRFRIVPPSCSASIVLGTPLATRYNTPAEASDTPFASTPVSIALTCTPPNNIESWSGKSQMVLGVGTTRSPLAGGISGVSAAITGLTLDTTNTNCTQGVAQTITDKGTYTTVGTSNVTTLTKYTAGTCTNYYTATLNYHTNGQAFNTTPSSLHNLVDTASGYISFLKPGDSPSTLPITTATGINAFTMNRPVGGCSATLNITDPANVNTSSPMANKYTVMRVNSDMPFLTKNLQVRLTCTPNLNIAANDTQLVVGAGSTPSPLQGGISGVNASMTALRIDTTASNCPANFATASVQTATTTSIQTNSAVNITTGCTNTYNATLTYFSNGDTFNNVQASVIQLTDNVGTYSSFMKAGSNPNTLQVTATNGVNAFTITPTQCRVVLRSKVKSN